MGIDYKKELENAAKNMILVHRLETLIKLIVRIIIQRVNITHAGILLYNKQRDSYVLTVSRGKSGKKIPKGFMRIDKNHPLIQFFSNNNESRSLIGGNVVNYEILLKIIRNRRYQERRDFFEEIKKLMEDLEVVTCIPCYFHNELLGIVLLGRKMRGGRFKRREIDFFQALASDVAMAIRNAQLFEELKYESERRYKLFMGSIFALAKEVDAKDHYTAGHTERVIDYSLAIAQKLKEKDNKNIITDQFIEDLKIASLLHDVGKIGIPEAILNKHDKLSEDEVKTIRQHTLIGVAILDPIKDFLKNSILGIKYHHERYDGMGYPEGLKESQIPLIAAIVGVADSYDAMITDRPYRKALSKEEAINEIKRCSGSQFHPEIANIMVDLYQEGKI